MKLLPQFKISLALSKVYFFWRCAIFQKEYHVLVIMLEMFKNTKNRNFSSLNGPTYISDNAGPNTPNSVTTDGLNQSAMEVDGGFPEDAGDQDNYPLFEGHSDSYISGW